MVCNGRDSEEGQRKADGHFKIELEDEVVDRLVNASREEYPGQALINVVKEYEGKSYYPEASEFAASLLFLLVRDDPTIRLYDSIPHN